MGEKIYNKVPLLHKKNTIAKRPCNTSLPASTDEVYDDVARMQAEKQQDLELYKYIRLSSLILKFSKSKIGLSWQSNNIKRKAYRFLLRTWQTIKYPSLCQELLVSETSQLLQNVCQYSKLFPRAC